MHCTIVHFSAPAPSLLREKKNLPPYFSKSAPQFLYCPMASFYHICLRILLLSLKWASFAVSTFSTLSSSIHSSFSHIKNVSYHPIAYKIRVNSSSFTFKDLPNPSFLLSPVPSLGRVPTFIKIGNLITVLYTLWLR